MDGTKCGCLLLVMFVWSTVNCKTHVCLFAPKPLESMPTCYGKTPPRVWLKNYECCCAAYRKHCHRWPCLERSIKSIHNTHGNKCPNVPTQLPPDTHVANDDMHVRAKYHGKLQRVVAAFVSLVSLAMHPLLDNNMPHVGGCNGDGCMSLALLSQRYVAHYTPQIIHALSLLTTLLGKPLPIGLAYAGRLAR